MSNNQKTVPETETPPPTVDTSELSTEPEAMPVPEKKSTILRPETSTNPTIVNR